MEPVEKNDPSSEARLCRPGDPALNLPASAAPVISGLSGPELCDEKRRDYRNAVLVQAALVAVALTVGDSSLAWPFFLAATAAYLLLLWDMLRNFTTRRWLSKGVLGLVVAVFACTVLVNQFGWTGGFEANQVNLVLSGLVLAVQGLVIGHAIADLFQSPRNTVDKLWGSACVYFMSGLAFACLIHALHRIDSGLFGRAVEPDIQGFFEAIYLSFSSLVGLESSYPDASHLLRNLTVLEGLWGQLYLVLLISRVLMPADPDSAAH